MPATPPTGSSAIDIRITGPAQDTVAVGSQVTFQITVTNRGPSPLIRGRIKDRFDPGLEHSKTPGANLIDGRLYDLAAGQSQQVPVIFRVAKAGRLCHVVEVTTSAGDVVLATQQACIMAVGEAAAPGPSQPSVTPPPIAPSPTGPPPASLSIKVTTGPTQLGIGETARFFSEVTNKGAATLRNVKVADRSDPAFDPTLATGGYQIENGVLTWIIDELPSGKSVRYEIQCKCQTAAPGLQSGERNARRRRCGR